LITAPLRHLPVTESSVTLPPDPRRSIIIDLIESHVDEENRELVLDWVMARRVAFDFMAERGLMTPDDWASMGLKMTK